jgi:hypothetical protein
MTTAYMMVAPNCIMELRNSDHLMKQLLQHHSTMHAWLFVMMV